MKAVDVAIVGGGIMGASIGYQIKRRSKLSVAVFDKGMDPSEGSTGASSAISRCRYSHPDVIRLAYQGQRAYRHWKELTELAEPRSALNAAGVVWMLGQSTGEVDVDVARLREQGARAERMGPEYLSELYPAVSTCVSPLDPEDPDGHECTPGEAFLYEPDGGYVDPVGANQDLLEALERSGGEVHFGSAVVGVRSDGERVIGIDLADGTLLDTGLVINAAGPWCNTINQLAGVDVRWTLIPTRVQTLFRSWPTELGQLPVAVDASTQIYFRPDGTDRVLVASASEEDEREQVDDPDSFKTSPDAEFREMKMAAFHHRVPKLVARGDIAGIAGLYTVNREDVHPIVGPSGKDGFWLANGFSGHGFKLAPAIGSMVAQAVTGEKASLDTDVPIEIFAVDREPIAVAAKNVLA